MSFQLSVKRSQADPQPARGLALVPARFIQDVPNMPAFEMAPGLAEIRRGNGGRPGVRSERAEPDHLRLPEPHGLLQDVLQLSDVALPRATHPRAKGRGIDIARYASAAGRSSGCSMKLVVESITPATSTLPSGSLTSFHTLHSCSWRGLAPAMTRPAGRAWITMSAMSSSGRSRWCGPPVLAQQTWMRIRSGGMLPTA